MYWTEKHALVCTASHCSQKGATEVIGKLRLEMVRRGLDKRIMINNCGTIDLCDCGPNIVIYPDNIIYSGVTTKDIPEIIDHLTGGPVVQRLVLSPDSGDELKRHDFYAEVTGDGDLVERDRFNEIAAKHQFDDAWIAEQTRRGFLAKREVEGEPVRLLVTSKALTRYGIKQ